MRCGDCSRTLHRGEARCTCGWVKPGREQESQHPFHRLPKCSRCSSTGFVLGPLRRIEQTNRFADRGAFVPNPWERPTVGACACPRGQMVADWNSLNTIPPEEDDRRPEGYDNGLLKDFNKRVETMKIGRALKKMPEVGGRKRLRFGIGTVDLEI